MLFTHEIELPKSLILQTIFCFVARKIWFKKKIFYSHEINFQREIMSCALKNILYFS